MWIVYTALGTLILLTAYFFTFPLSKKRPVLVKHKGLVWYVTALTVAVYPLLEFTIFLIGIAPVVLLMVFYRMWFVYGVTDIKTIDALEKAALATRSPIEKMGQSYRIDNSVKVLLHKIAGKVYIISFKKGGESKKAQLTMVVFSKFIQNYFV